MATKKNSNSEPADTNQDITTIISSNLKRLISQNHTTQKELAERIGVAPATMTDYCKGRRVPNVDFLLALKNLYDISIDDFLTKSIRPTGGSSAAAKYSIDPNILATYRKYCGIYFIYYFDTARYKGRDTQTPKESVHFGILFIYENPSSLSNPEFSCAAILGIEDREECAALKETLESLGDASRIIDFIDTKYSGTAFHGDFELSPDHAFISMSHANTNKALLIIHRVDNNKRNYTGGIGTINYVSKGRERAPVVQFMGISRYPLVMSVEEIHHSLLLNYPGFSAETETEEMIRGFKALYMDDNETVAGFTEYQKSIMIRSMLERYIRKSLERNVFRYGKISERDDDSWYHAIKTSSRNDGKQ